MRMFRDTDGNSRIGHDLPRGHSNIYENETEPYPGCEEKARIPLVGGSRVDTCRPLPPLALSREEWEEIGRRMGWMKRRRKAVVERS